MAKKTAAKNKVTTKKAGLTTKVQPKKANSKDKVKPKVPAAKKERVKKVTVEVLDPNQDFEQDHELSEDTESPEVSLDDSAAYEESHLPAEVETPVLDHSSSRGLTTTDPVALYMAEIRKYPVLTREQEQEIAQKYHTTKDPKLAQVLVTSNLRFVVKIAAEYSRFGARMIDLIQEGNMGLMHAVRDFNPYRGTKLITYAVWWIRGYIQEYLMKQYSLVKIGTTQNQKKLFYQLQKQKEKLEQLASSPEQLQQLSSELGIPEDEIQQMALRMSGKDVSLNVTVDEGGNTSLLDFQKTEDRPPDEELALREQLQNLKDILEELRPDLNEKELIILEERLLSDEPLTLQEIGEKYKITREAVRQTEARLMKKIRDHMSRE